MDLDPDRIITALLRAYQSSVIQAAEGRGHGKLTFGDALLALPSDVVNDLQDSYRKQVEEVEGGKGDRS